MTVAKELLSIPYGNTLLHIYSTNQHATTGFALSMVLVNSQYGMLFNVWNLLFWVWEADEGNKTTFLI